MGCKIAIGKMMDAEKVRTSTLLYIDLLGSTEGHPMFMRRAIPLCIMFYENSNYRRCGNFKVVVEQLCFSYSEVLVYGT